MKETTNFDRLKMATRKICNEEEYIRFLNFSKKFYDLDYKNQLLIFLQNPVATKVKTFMDWKKEGRKVKKNPRKIFLYGYYKEKKAEKIDGQLDIGGFEKNKRKTTIEYFNGVPYRRTCNYDIDDTFADKDKPKSIRESKTVHVHTKQEFLKCLENISGIKIVEKESTEELIELEDEITIYSNLSAFQNISLAVHQLCHYWINNKFDLKNIGLEKFSGESVGFLVANYFGLDTNIYNFSDLNEIKELNIESKIEIGTFIQKEAKEIINLLLERLNNKEQICA